MTTTRASGGTGRDQSDRDTNIQEGGTVAEQGAGTKSANPHEHWEKVDITKQDTHREVIKSDLPEGKESP